MKHPLVKFYFLMLSAFVLLVMPFLVAAQESLWLARLKQQKWMNKVNALKLLKTSRIEAEGILGEPDKYDFYTNPSSKDYTLINGRVSINYTTKECTSVDGKIAKDTIEDISFSPKDKILFSKLRLPLKQFKYFSYSDTPGGYYVNEQTGITIYLDWKNKKVDSIDFEIPEQKNFSCVTIPTFLNDLEKINDIKFLQSNRDDVRKIFAGYDKSSQSKDSEYHELFYSSDASFEFSYSEGKCEFDDSDGYDTTEWNVESVKISPINSINPQEFGIDLRNV